MARMKIESRLETMECAAADDIGGVDIFQRVCCRAIRTGIGY
ncbi:unnamed protein product [Haemonchus placei]|uniref:Uncharacterized protein n=1 Tax=Haemonchus placei TaxID=6290 RepID=A0A0N4X2E6_HAEPC|nr:unnamed protein product [Haemonchus placei]